ncbi:hypothetical protein ISF41_22290 [Burkholderia pseudomallei]|nr:hypothetical protein [Burkholderia pseudomallei]
MYRAVDSSSWLICGDFEPRLHHAPTCPRDKEAAHRHRNLLGYERIQRIDGFSRAIDPTMLKKEAHGVGIARGTQAQPVSGRGDFGPRVR